MPLRVVALEHDLTIAELYRELLSPHGYEVTVRCQPIDDPQALTPLQPDLILLELLVTWESAGPQFIETLKTHPATATIPLVVCTAAADLLPQVEPVLAAYGVPVITKPFHIGHFVEVIRHALAEPSIRATEQTPTASP